MNTLDLFNKRSYCLVNGDTQAVTGRTAIKDKEKGIPTMDGIPRILVP